jgi:hypothetical protein
VQDVTKLSGVDRIMLENFATTFKNSNKGIKGRGKHRRVGPASAPVPCSPGAAMTGQYGVHPPMMPQASHHGHHQPAMSAAHGLPLPGSAYPMSRTPVAPGMMMQMGPRDPRGAYDMYDAEHDGSGTASTSGTIYEDDHGRGDLAFGDRMY